MFTLREKVGRCALTSRLFVIVLQCLSNLLILDHDTKIFTSPLDPQEIPGRCDYVIDFFLGGLVRWDAQYFLHIAKYGYTYENCLAFFPLFPIAAQFLATSVFSPFTLFFTNHSLLILSFTFVNLFCFTKAALTLYDLSLYVLKSEELAYKSAIFFCLNPASIFFTAPYSESLFALCTFQGFLCSATNKTRTSALNFGFSCATRSNGIVNIGFTIHKQLRELFYTVSTKNLVFILLIPLQTIATLIPLVICISVTLLPFIMFQIFSFGKFCIDDRQIVPQFIINHAGENNFKLAGSEPSIWCNSSIPLAYSYVQSHYWDVGFLKYYEWKQIPNFLLALPTVLLVLYPSLVFLCRYPRHCLLLGFPYTKAKAEDKKRKGPLSPPPEAFLYIAHAMCLLLFCVLCIHVQVTSRMISSSSPVLYWFATYLSLPCTLQQEKMQPPNQSTATARKPNVESSVNMQSNWKVFLLTEEPPHLLGKCVHYFFSLYMIIGTILFSNNFPWT